MKVTIKSKPDLLEDYAEIHCKEENPAIRKLADYIETVDKKLLGKSKDTMKLLDLDDIFYFESVDKKTFAYLENSVWETEITLRETEETLYVTGFVRISKSVVVNLYKVEQLKNDFEMRMLLEMENGETLVLNRHYRKDFKRCLEEMKKNLAGGTYEADRKK